MQESESNPIIDDTESGETGAPTTKAIPGNGLNFRARKERNMKFITYLRTQMMQEYGFDFEDFDEKAKQE